MEDNFHQHRVIPGHTVAFYDIRDLFYIRVKFFLADRFYFQIDKRFDMIIKRLRIDVGKISDNDTVLLQPVDSGRDSGR